MNVVYLISDYGLVSETFIQDLVAGLGKEVKNLTLICNQITGEQSSLPQNVSIETCQFMNLSRWQDRIQRRIRYSLTPSFDHNDICALKKNAHRQLFKRLKIINPDVIYMDYGTVAAITHEVLQELNIPFIVHFHGADITSALRDHAYREELKKVFRNSSALVAASHHVRRLLVLEGAPDHKIHVVRLGFNLEGIKPTEWSIRKQQQPSVVFLGRFTAKKNPVALIESFALVCKNNSSVQLTMIGEGPEISKVQERIKKHSLENRVKLQGELPRKQALDIVNNNWVYAQHSVTASTGDQEGFGITLAEAAALGLPVVSTWHNGIPEQVTHEKTGYLVQEYDYEQMAEYILRLINNTDLCEQLGVTGMNHIKNLCDSQKRLQNIITLLEGAIRKK